MYIINNRTCSLEIVRTHDKQLCVRNNTQAELIVFVWAFASGLNWQGKDFSVPPNEIVQIHDLDKYHNPVTATVVCNKITQGHPVCVGDKQTHGICIRHHEDPADVLIDVLLSKV